MSKTSPTPIVLTDEEWARMTARRREENQKSISWHEELINLHKLKNKIWGKTENTLTPPPELLKIDEPEYKEMVEAFINGTEAWFKWQKSFANNGSSSAPRYYDFQYLNFSSFEEKFSIFEKNFSIQLISIEFIKPTLFDYSRFYSLILTDCVFTRSVSFEHAKFCAFAGFDRTSFSKDVFFGSAKSHIAISFQDVYIENIIDFSSMNFENNSSLDIQTNFKRMSFGNKGNLILDNAIFKRTIPDFRYSRIPDIRLNNTSIPAPNNLNWNKENEDMYRKLKELAIANHNHEYELKFNGYEMESKIINAGNAVPFYHAIFSNLFFPVGLLPHALLRAIFFSMGKGFFNRLKKYKHRLFSIWASRFSIWRAEAKKQILSLPEIIFLKIYKCLSNFGQSIILPAFWLVVLAGVYYLRFHPVSFDLIKIMMPIPLFVNNFNANENINELGFGIKSLATILWFLLGLGIRNNFKIK